MAIETPEKFKGKEAFYEKMMRMLVKMLPDTWASFDDAVADMEKTKNFVHTIKGTAGNLDATEVYQCAVQFEATLRAGAPDGSLYQKFIDACEALKKSLPPPSA